MLPVVLPRRVASNVASSVIEFSLNAQGCYRHASCIAHNCAFSYAALVCLGGVQMNSASGLRLFLSPPPSSPSFSANDALGTRLVCTPRDIDSGGFFGRLISCHAGGNKGVF